MKFLHTADLHIGKKIYEQSLISDQKYILDRILEIALKEQVDAVLIAGDVYDRAIPPTEAVTLLDEFLTSLHREEIPVIAVSGNHDSPERLSFGDRILEEQGLYISGNLQEPLRTVSLQDQYGPVQFVLLPFVRPAVVGAGTSAEAVETILARQPRSLSLNERHVLVTHFFVVGDNGETPELSDSETDTQVGGLDGVPASLFQSFDYVALGHIHKPQHMGRGNVYYAGSPLKYSFSEAGTDKAVNIVELGAPGAAVQVRRVPLVPMRDMRCIKGSLRELMSSEALEANKEGIEDYLQVILTDQEELIDPIGTLRSVYPNVLSLLLEKNFQEADEVYETRLTGKRKTAEELFGEFYQLLREEPLEGRRLEIVKEVAAVCEGTYGD